MNLDRGAHDIYVGYPLISVGAKLKDKRFGAKVMVVSDANVAALFGKTVVGSLKRAGKQVFLTAVPPGEKSKCLQQAYALLKECSTAGLERNDTVLSLGGGVVGDLGGFVASLYMRGIAHVAVPTTLLAQVDSSIGGKTAVNLPWAKNLIGSFHQPALVYMDQAVLRTLPEKEMRQGLAEIIKTGLIGSAPLFDFLEAAAPEQLRARLPSVVTECAVIKKTVVELDEYEKKGLREILNFGHTLGHAIEISRTGRYNHGDAVALGLAGETLLGWKLGYCGRDALERVEAILKKYRLPWDIRSVRMPDVVEYLKYDKKNRGGKIRFVLPRKIGEVVAGVEITPEFVLSTWEQYGRQ